MRLEWRGPADCDAADFERSLATHLAGSSEQRRVSVRVRVTHDPRGRWTARLALTVGDVRSARRLAGDSCLAVSEAAAFITAVLVDPGVLTRPPVPEPAPEPTPTPEPTPEPPLPTLVPEAPAIVAAPRPLEPPAPRAEASPPRPPRPRPAGFVRLTGGLEALGLPRLGPQVALAGGLLGRRWRVELGAMYRAPTRARADVDPSAGASIRMWTASARGCGVVRPAVLEITLCAGLELGRARGAGFGYDGARSDRIPWLAGLLAPALAWAPRRWFAVWLGAELAVPLLGGSFDVVGLGPLFTIAPVSLRAATGLELRFF